MKNLQRRLQGIESGKIEDINIDRRTQSISKRLDEERKATLGASEEGRKDPRNDEDLENDVLESLQKLVSTVASDLKTGGSKALASAANKINSSAGATLLIQAIAKNLDKYGTKETVSRRVN